MITCSYFKYLTWDIGQFTHFTLTSKIITRNCFREIYYVYRCVCGERKPNIVRWSLINKILSQFVVSSISGYFLLILAGTIFLSFLIIWHCNVFFCIDVCVCAVGWQPLHPLTVRGCRVTMTMYQYNLIRSKHIQSG